MQIHEYRCELAWSGSTGGGYRGYPRAHRVRFPANEVELELTSDPAFRGDVSLLNPELLLTAAAASCQLLSFLALAARAEIDVLSYSDQATARMPMDLAYIETITLRPIITVAGAVDEARVMRLVEEAHETCYIARSLKSTVTIEARVEVAGP